MFIEFPQGGFLGAHFASHFEISEFALYDVGHVIAVLFRQVVAHAQRHDGHYFIFVVFTIPG